MSRTAVVWGTWAVLSLAGLGFVAEYGRNCPHMDEWAFLAAYVGEHDFVTWLWEPHLEHRYPLGRLVHLGLFRLTGDLRSGMVLNVVCLSGAAALLLAAAGRVRGHGSLSDLFFPLALLHPGHRENVLMSYQVCFTLPVLITAGLAYLTFRPAEAWSWRRAGAVGGMTALLPGFGVSGLVLAVGAALPLAVAVPLLFRRGDRGAAVLLAGGLVLTGAGVGVVLANHLGIEAPGISRSLSGMWPFTTRIFAMGFGPAAEWLWLPGVAAVGTIVVRGLLAVSRAGPGGAVDAAAALAVPAGGGLLAAALVWGRGWTGAEGALASRYAALMLPLTFAAFLIAVRFGGRRLREWGPAALAVLAAVAWPLNAMVGVEQAGRVARHVDAVEADVRAGLPPHLLLERYDWQLWVADPRLGRAFEQAARVGFPAFRSYASTASAPLQTTPLALAAGERGAHFPAGTAARLTGRFVHTQNRFADIRLRLSTSDGRAPRDESFRVVKNSPNHFVVRLDGRPARVEVITADGDGEFRLTTAELLSPGE